MASHGIYILANDIVFDQLVALLNSIEVNVSRDLPVCVIPYDDRVDRVREELTRRPNGFLFEDLAALDRWERFAWAVWAVHPRAKQRRSRPGWYGGHLQRRLAAFDGPFDRFVVYDADSLAMKPVDDIFAKLDEYEFVFDDWEHKKPIPVAPLNIPHLEAIGRYTEAELRPQLHCISFFGAKRESFSSEDVEAMREQLVDKGEVVWINGQGWWDDAFLFNYMTLWRDRPMFNYTLSPNGFDRTGNCALADPFINIDNVLYNAQGKKPIYRLHYMNVPSISFTRLCQGEDVDIPYREVFLHYRFLKDPEQRPKTFRSPSLLTKFSRRVQRDIKRIRKLKQYLPELERPPFDDLPQ
ncbi:MAG: methionine synthase [Cyanobacteria bacterium SID2]|nr:methionine synthase [Cyanobacteria bacterium SID2]MBP0006599.1 methionine synthase [Cyanobacteria bacterium SBC]